MSLASSFYPSRDIAKPPLARGLAAETNVRPLASRAYDELPRRHAVGFGAWAPFKGQPDPVPVAPGLGRPGARAEALERRAAARRAVAARDRSRAASLSGNRHRDDFAKRAFDVAVAGGLLLVLLPLLLMVAAAVRLESRGPILFRQRRTGLNGRVFHILKFRSMRTMDDGPVVRQAAVGDDRITRVGRLIRATSLDELPQLLNVVRGEMSLVGPRPHALAHDEYYRRHIPTYNQRFLVRPGITGLAQVRGLRGETPTVDSMAARVAKDIQYVRHRSLWLDLKILSATIKVLKGY